MVNVKKIEEAFKKATLNDEKLIELRKAIKATGDFGKVEDYAKRLAELMDETIRGLPVDELEPVLQTLTKIAGNYVNYAGMTAQNVLNEQAGVGLAPIIQEKTDKLVMETFQQNQLIEDPNALYDKLKNVATTENLRQVDTIQKNNARFQSNSGLTVTVSRYYDEIGLRNRTQKCAWCLSRCGENVPYDKAVAMGMFERHEGCGCKIIYKTGKSTTVQTRKGKWTNE